MRPAVTNKNIVIDGARFKITRVAAESSLKVQLVIWSILIFEKSWSRLDLSTSSLPEQCTLCTSTQKHTNQTCLRLMWSRWKNLIKLPLDQESWLISKGDSQNINFPSSGTNRSIFLPLELPWIPAKTLISLHKSKTWLCIVFMVFQSSLGVFTEGCS